MLFSLVSLSRVLRPFSYLSLSLGGLPVVLLSTLTATNVAPQIPISRFSFALVFTHFILFALKLFLKDASSMLMVAWVWETAFVSGSIAVSSMLPASFFARFYIPFVSYSDLPILLAEAIVAIDIIFRITRQASSKRIGQEMTLVDQVASIVPFLGIVALQIYLFIDIYRQDIGIGSASLVGSTLTLLFIAIVLCISKDRGIYEPFMLGVCVAYAIWRGVANGVGEAGFSGQKLYKVFEFLGNGLGLVLSKNLSLKLHGWMDFVNPAMSRMVPSYFAILDSVFGVIAAVLFPSVLLDDSSDSEDAPLWNADIYKRLKGIKRATSHLLYAFLTLHVSRHVISTAMGSIGDVSNVTRVFRWIQAGICLIMYFAAFISREREA